MKRKLDKTVRGLLSARHEQGDPGYVPGYFAVTTTVAGRPVTKKAPPSTKKKALTAKAAKPPVEVKL